MQVQQKLAGQMQEAIIVGVSNGLEARMAEYLPPYAAFRFYPERGKGRARRSVPILEGRADLSAAYYAEDVAPFIAENFRVRAGREHAVVDACARASHHEDAHQPSPRAARRQ